MLKPSHPAYDIDTHGRLFSGTDPCGENCYTWKITTTRTLKGNYLSKLLGCQKKFAPLRANEEVGQSLNTREGFQVA